MRALHYTICLFTLGFLVNTKVIKKPGIECYSCDGPYNLCSGKFFKITGCNDEENVMNFPLKKKGVFREFL